MATFINQHLLLWQVLAYGVAAATLGVGGAWLGSAWRIPQAPAAGRRWARAFGGLAVLMVVVWRQPSVWQHDNHQIDELDVVVGMPMVAHDPVPFRGCVMGTSGPLQIYLLLPLQWLGLSATPPTARLLALAMVVALVLTTLLVTARAGGAGVAVPITWAVTAWGAFATELDTCDWNSEFAPLGFMALAVGAYALARTASAAAPLWLYAAGLLLGGVPYLKLQAVPQALVLAAVGAIALWRNGLPRRTRAWHLLALVAGGFSLPLAFTVLTVAAGAWSDFTQTYLAYAVTYGKYREFSLAALGGVLGGFDTPWYLGYCLLVTGSALALAGRWWRYLAPGAGGWLAAASLHLAVALYAAWAPGRPYPHYASLLVAPLAWWCAALLAPAWQALCAAATAGQRTRGRLWLAVCGLAVAGWLALYQGHWYVDYPTATTPLTVARGNFAAGWRWQLPVTTHGPLRHAEARAIAARLAPLQRPGDTLAIWGWAPDYFLETGMRNATRFTLTDTQMPGDDYAPPVQAYGRAAYLADLAWSRPAWFIDAVASYESVYQERARLGHESWPALTAWLEADYVLVGELAHAPGDGTRVYLRRDCAQDRGVAPPPRTPAGDAGTPPPPETVRAPVPAG